MPTQQKVAVIVGGGIAGATCATALLSLCRHTTSDVKVILVSPTAIVRIATEGSARYEVNVLSASANEWAGTTGIEYVQSKAIAMYPSRVLLDDGRSIEFDVCCLATGARPRLPTSLLTNDQNLRQRILVIRDTDTVLSLKNALTQSRRVAIVGNGGIALELVHSIRHCEIVWIVRDKHIGNSFFDARGGQALFQFLGASKVRERTRIILGRSNTGNPAGLSLHPSTGDSVNEHDPISKEVLGAGVGPRWTTESEGNILPPIAQDLDKGTCADPVASITIEYECEVTHARLGSGCKPPVILELSSGSSLSCDFVICATGVAPNTEWLGQESGIVVDSGTASDRWEYEGNFSDAGGGVLVQSDTMRSISVHRVYAAGDCATVVKDKIFASDCSSQNTNWFQMRLWTQAAVAGRNAASSMAVALTGSDGIWGGVQLDLFSHATHFFGKRVVFLGRYNAQGLRDGYKILEGGGGPQDNYFVRTVVENGKLRGALLVGDTDLSETYENLILDCLDVSHLGAELVDPSIDLADYFD